MVRKRAGQLKKQKARKPISFELKKEPAKKQRWIVLALVSIMFLTLFFNSYFNYTSGVAVNEDGETLGEKYYLLGPDPYYHARITEYIYYNGEVPYWQDGDYDPLLEYPMTHPNPRPPLFDFTMAVGAWVLSPFMEDIDALGNSLQFMPAIFGALLVLPVYGIGSLLFNKKTAIAGALFIAIIPIHLGSGHGSAFALADHDSFILLLTTTGLFFFIKTLQSLNEKTNGFKELFYNNKKTISNSIITGVCFAGVAMSWEGFKFVVVILSLYCVFQLLVNCFFKKNFLGITMVGLITLLTTSLIISPYYFLRGTFNDVQIVLSLAFIVFVLGTTLYFLSKKETPYIMTLPALGVGGIVSLIVINNYHIMPFYYFVSMFFKGTVYVGKISLTIAEAGSPQISGAVMGYGPAIYWFAWFGAIIFMARTLLHRKNEMIFFSIWFVMTFYFTTTAGRFLNDFVPFVAIFTGWTIMFIVEKLDYKQMFKNIKSTGGLAGLKKVKIMHVFGVIFLAFIVIMPNVILAFDASVPWEEKGNYEGVPMGAYGISFGKEAYWTDAFSWLNEQDLDIENPADRPAFISWWDYGFYEVAMGGHPTVADNFQDGIEPAANFITATSEKDAITVLIARLVHGDFSTVNNGESMSKDVSDILDDYLGETKRNYISLMLDDLFISELVGNTNLEYNEPICEEYEPELSQYYTKNKFNTYYHTFVNFTSNLTDDEITNFYMDIQDVTGWDIRYYGTETYDTSIFSVFTFLSDKSLIPVGGVEDEYQVGFFRLINDTTDEFEYITRDELFNMTSFEREYYDITGPHFSRKPAYYETMFYKTFYGTPVTDGSFPDNRMPTYGLKHFIPGYISPYVTIAKYYEGAKINGIVTCQNVTLPGVTVVVFDNWGIPHDMTMFLEDYNVIVPAGELNLGIYMGDVMLKVVNVNITELEATRRSENYNKTVNIEVDPITLYGNVFDNDTIMSNVEISIFNQMTGMYIRDITNDFGEYEFKDIPPGAYRIDVIENNVYLHNETIVVPQDMNYDVEV